MTQSLTLALETSCDETSAAVVANGRTILANIISSQVPTHQKFGGVVPEIASRKHIENVIPVIEQALSEAGTTLADIDAIGVTYGPGLVGALLVGVATAKTLAFALNKPLIGVNHLEGHIFANFLAHKELQPPFVALVVSGGHTSLIHLKDYNELVLLGQTRDDAAGEAFDKIARVMNFPYPGGPHIDNAAKQGNPQAIAFPRAFAVQEGENKFAFSFSGLKSAVLNYLNSAKQREETVSIPDVAASFQAAVVDVLVMKTIMAAEQVGVDKIVLAGGVAANSSLQSEMAARTTERGFKLFYPPAVLCTDNAAMIACRAYYQYLAKDFADLHLNAVPSLKLGCR
ncbi:MULTISPECIES: tRNA (adenosine(37)-N6)-threonylcarbamoyltransferase complex transferase subunit TsaD [Sporomusa]|jgi:N6-L-threonylcarbamoyladenine synthase|uniref:tRNA (adenosine(37)-N6)-threonylcarbamoyltransferase complex transferase subunit TsaD n=1 Tax=Sporomusa TaxID=2375 RepID=UPI001664C4E0|nr:MULTISPECIES: tRNA (adenosine(37)-N6)-threonylcarbamoyltransferase complex transferase subunit TsaD [Sporomusa]MCM0757735.1 tRNA (adenosine(37)-N6)-threonylcarbamoyltransferase complex transferase subunit TsaD [Sporomusa sphaeroides DSM 2875]HML35710.1 tRNA (adenosine(37)-N6)-threonylcarbamoyltransferase complex transferase subunit TsaD [Sporomusa sphaeroides]